MTRTEHLAIKGTRDGLVLYLDPGVEFQVVLEELKHYLSESSQFLQGATVRCYAGEREYDAGELHALTDVLALYNLTLSGWLKATEVYGKATRTSEVEREKGDESVAEGSCLFVDRSLRSGHSVQYEGHVVVLGDVNPGAEIICTGNIVVLGVLRGVAHAGSSGDRSATVSAYHLIPTQLRIADLVTRAPDGGDEWDGPEIARVKDGQLIVEQAGMTRKGSLR